MCWLRWLGRSRPTRRPRRPGTGTRGDLTWARSWGLAFLVLAVELRQHLPLAGEIVGPVERGGLRCAVGLLHCGADQFALLLRRLGLVPGILLRERHIECAGFPSDRLRLLEIEVRGGRGPLRCPAQRQRPQPLV